jgi:hypothetical protein
MQTHGAAGTVKLLLQHQPGRNRTVHTAAHTDQSLFVFHRTPPGRHFFEYNNDRIESQRTILSVTGNRKSYKERNKRISLSLL